VLGEEAGDALGFDEVDAVADEGHAISIIAGASRGMYNRCSKIEADFACPQPQRQMP
jgi:hypothetical protein